MVNPGTRKIVAAYALGIMVFPSICATAGDTYYRWNDASGTPVNSDRPPPAGVEYDVITTNTNQMVDERTVEADMAEPAIANTDNSPRQQTSSTQAAESDKDPEACATARKNMETLNTHARIRVPDGNGNFRFLNEEEKAQQLEHSQAAIDHYCE